MMIQSKMKYELALKDETSRSKGTQSPGKSREHVQITLLLRLQLDQRQKDV